eukprot:5684931-Amphidinium_carterae.1
MITSIALAPTYENATLPSTGRAAAVRAGWGQGPQATCFLQMATCRAECAAGWQVLLPPTEPYGPPSFLPGSQSLRVHQSNLGLRISSLPLVALVVFLTR